MNMTVESALKHLKDACLRNANDEDAHFMAKYMKFNFSYFGIKTPLRRDIFKEFYKNFDLDKGEMINLVEKLWGEKERELHYLAMDLLIKQKKQMGIGDIDFIEGLILRNSWWDSIDVLAPKIALGILEKDEAVLEYTIERWIPHENMWLNRSAILVQLKRKSKTNDELLYRTILRRSESKEFFIQKACGWALREYYRTNPKSVVDFVEGNVDRLRPLTIREALKHHVI